MKELSKERIEEIKKSLAENPWKQEKNHRIFNNPAIEHIYGYVDGTDAIGGSYASIDYEECEKERLDDGEMGTFQMKLDIDYFEWDSMIVHSISNDVDINWIQSISKQGVDTLFSMGELHWNELQVSEGEGFFPTSIKVEPPKPKQPEKVKFFPNPWKWFLNLFKPKTIIEYVHQPRQCTMLAQRKLLSKILSLSNMIAVKGRRGPANTVIVGPKLAMALQDCAGFTFSQHMTGPSVEQIAGTVYAVGSIAGITILVDPYMSWNDNRICVYRNGRPDEPGLKLAYQSSSFEKTVSDKEGNYKIFKTGKKPYLTCITIELKDIEQLEI